MSDAACVIAAFVLLAMSVIAVVHEQRATYEVITGFFCAFICLVPLIFRRAKILELPLTMVIMIEVAIFLHAYGVLLMKYDDLYYWDSVTHTVSSLTVALCAFYALMVVNVSDPMVHFTRRWMPVFIFLIMVAFGAIWESFEFAVDNLTGTNMQYSPWDTYRDLLCDVLGAVLMAIYSYIYLGKRSEKDFVDGLNIHSKLGKITKSRG